MRPLPKPGLLTGMKGAHKTKGVQRSTANSKKMQAMHNLPMHLSSPRKRSRRAYPPLESASLSSIIYDTRVSPMTAIGTKNTTTTVCGQLANLQEQGG